MVTRKFELGYSKLQKKKFNFLLNHKKRLCINL